MSNKSKSKSDGLFIFDIQKTLGNQKKDNAVLFTNFHEFVQWRIVASHAENPVGDDERAFAFADIFVNLGFKIVHVVVFVDTFLGGARKFGRVDDAVMVQFVADEDSFGRCQWYDDAHAGYISGT